MNLTKRGCVIIPEGRGGGGKGRWRAGEGEEVEEEEVDASLFVPNLFKHNEPQPQKRVCL